MLSGGPQSSHDPCNPQYRGPFPFSEPCTQNIRDAILAISNRTRMFVDLHSPGLMWLTPYFAGPPDPSDSDELVRIAMPSNFDNDLRSHNHNHCHSHCHRATIIQNKNQIE